VREPGEQCRDDGDGEQGEGRRDGRVEGLNGPVEPFVEGGRGRVVKARWPEERKLLAERRERSEFAHGLLALEDLLRRDRVEEKTAESVTAESGTRGGEKREERARAEDIKIVGVKVRGGKEFVAGVSGEGRGPVDALEVAGVEGLEAIDALQLVLETEVRGYHAEKCDGGKRGCPVGQRRVRAQQKKGDERGACGENDAITCTATMDPGQFAIKLCEAVTIVLFDGEVICGHGHTLWQG